MTTEVGSREPAVDLLIRAPGGAGYELRTFTALESGLGFRPVPASPESYEVNEVPGDMPGVTSYLLRHNETGRVVRLSAHGYHLFSEMTGQATILDLVTSCFMRWGAIAPEEVWRTVRELRLAGLVESRAVELPLVRRRSTGALGLLAQLVAVGRRLRVDARQVDDWFRAAYILGGRRLFAPGAMYAYVFLVALGVCAFVAQGDFRTASAYLTQPWRLAACLGLTAVIVALHEAAHGLGCTHFSRPVRGIGVRLRCGLVPVPYTDVTDIWMATRHARTTVYLAGPTSTALIGCALALLGWGLAGGAAGHLMHAAAAMAFAIAGLTLCPFLPLPTDGYHLLADHAGCLSLREDAWRFVTRILPGRVVRREGLSAWERQLLLYAIAVLLVTAAAVVIALAMAHGLLVHLGVLPPQGVT